MTEGNICIKSGQASNTNDIGSDANSAERESIGSENTCGNALRKDRGGSDSFSLRASAGTVVKGRGRFSDPGNPPGVGLLKQGTQSGAAEFPNGEVEGEDGKDEEARSGNEK